LNEKKNNDKKVYKKAKIKDKNGLNISYDKKELEDFMPNLISEISNKKKTLKIDSIKLGIDQENKEPDQIPQSCIPNELINPGAVDFIRRCKTQEEAFEILDYILKRKELTLEQYKKFKDKISQKDGLKRLIEESGGFKEPGYYVNKYYKKEFEVKKFNKNKI